MELNQPKPVKIELAILFDIYGKLLTEKQQQILELYCNMDNSLAEIAELLDISRQGVRDAIVTAEKAMLEYESKLGVLKSQTSLNYNLDLAKSLLEQQNYAELREVLNKMGE